MAAGSVATLTGTKKPRLDVSKTLVSIGVQSYDADNGYPNRFLNTLDASATGTACANLAAKHYYGAGWKDPEFAKIKVNRYGLTANGLLKKLAADYAKLNAFAFSIVYNGFGEAVEFLYIPVEQIRYTIADDWGFVQKLAVYDDWDNKRRKRFDPSKVYKIDRFDPRPEVISKQIENAGGFNNWNGQIYYFADSFPEYPKAPGDPVFKDIETDGLIQVFRNRAVTKGFMPNGMLAHPGRFESQAKREEFVESMQEFQGAENSNSLLLVEYDTPELKPEFIPMTYPDADKVFDLTENRTRDSIIMAYNQPPILLGVQVPGKLGGTNERNEAKIQYDEVTSETRQTIAEKIGGVFKRCPRLANPSGEYLITPISDSITKGGSSLFGALGADAINKVLEIIKDATLTPDQKTAILLEFYNIPEDKTKKLLTNGAE